MQVLREFASTHDAIKKIASVSSSDTTFTYDELISSFEGIAFSEAETRTLLLALDPNDTGLIRAYAVEHEVHAATFVVLVFIALISLRNPYYDARPSDDPRKGESPASGRLQESFWIWTTQRDADSGGRQEAAITDQLEGISIRRR